MSLYPYFRLHAKHWYICTYFAWASCGNTLTRVDWVESTWAFWNFEGNFKTSVLITKGFSDKCPAPWLKYTHYVAAFWSLLPCPPYSHVGSYDVFGWDWMTAICNTAVYYIQVPKGIPALTNNCYCVSYVPF